MMSKQIPIVIPSYEPDDFLYNTCKALVEAGLCNIIVVNDGSSQSHQKYFDAIKKDFSIPVLEHSVNRGKGRALKTAFEYIIQNIPDAIGCVTADSDGQHTPKDIKKCIESLAENQNSLILGCRDFSKDDVPLKSRFGNELTKKTCSFLCGIQVSDTQTGLRGIPLSFMKELLSVKGERFEFETYMLIESKGKYPITEIEIETVYDSKENHKTHFDPIRDSIRIYKIFGIMFLKFIFSSLSSFLIDVLLFSLFCLLFKESFPIYYAGIATVLARVLSATYNCLINYKFVFKSEQRLIKSIVKYFALAVCQMLVSALLVTAGTLLLTNIPATAIKIVIDLFLFFASYYIQNRYVF